MSRITASRAALAGLLRRLAAVAQRTGAGVATTEGLDLLEPGLKIVSLGIPLDLRRHLHRAAFLKKVCCQVRLVRNTRRLAVFSEVGGSNTSRTAAVSDSLSSRFGDGLGLMTEEALVHAEDPDESEA